MMCFMGNFSRGRGRRKRGLCCKCVKKKKGKKKIVFLFWGGEGGFYGSGKGEIEAGLTVNI